MERVVLSLGSNAGTELDGDNLSPSDILRKACEKLSLILKNMECSSVYRTKPMYYEKQNDFYNMAVTGFYEGSPYKLLDDIHEIEKMYGRDRSKEIVKGPRSLDIDIVLFAFEILDDKPLLMIPHVGVYERLFVLVPMLEILPEVEDPKSKKPFKSFLEKLPFDGIEKLDKV